VPPSQPLTPAKTVHVSDFSDPVFRSKLGQIVLAKGVYDLTHYGHVLSFWAAKQQGNTLVVAVATDESVQKRKGKGRPILTLDERVGIVSSLRMVDYVVTYDTNSPFEMVSAILPHCICATHFDFLSGDERRSLLSRGVRLEQLQRPQTKSTSDIINHIVNISTSRE
jgi:rfaE bifunctional protein nucleotidyltransferase chain/domain